MHDAGSPSSSLDGHIKLNRAAREAHNRQKRTRAHQQGTRMLQEQMDSMASMHRVSEEAANQRAIDQRQFQYDMMVYQAAVKDRHCRQRMQAAQNADISRSNDQALKYAELTNTHPLPMRQAVWVIFPEPVRPQPPVNGQQQAAAADAQAADRAAVAPTPYTVMPQGRQPAITPALVGSEAAALHAGTAVSGSRGRDPMARA